jgi:uncharacterized protein
MPNAPIRTFRCPTCSSLLLATDEDFPFCSDRCRRIDLGKWASGDYKISSPILDPEVLDSLPAHQQPRSSPDDDE